MKYFLHDSNAFEDEKISELFMAFGYEGLGLFYTLLEKLAKQEKPVKTVVLKRHLKVGKKLDKCWNFMEEIGLISSNNGETFNKQLLNFSENYKIKKEKNAKRISEWRDKQEVTENVTHSENVRNTSKVKESKVNEVIIDKSIIVGLDKPTTTDVAKPLSFEDKCLRFINMFNRLRMIGDKPAKYQTTVKVKTALKARLKNYDGEKIKKAISTALLDPYHIESNFFYLTPEYILREEILERYLNAPDVIPRKNGYDKNKILQATGEGLPED